MKNRKYLVTNMSEGSICVTGRIRIDIPGMCRDLPLSLPENTARHTISRLKQRYPLLKIRETRENPVETPIAQKTKAPEEKGQESASGHAAIPPQDVNDPVTPPTQAKIRPRPKRPAPKRSRRSL